MGCRPLGTTLTTATIPGLIRTMRGEAPRAKWAGGYRLEAARRALSQRAVKDVAQVEEPAQ
jgi:hypothetical protein